MKYRANCTYCEPMIRACYSDNRFVKDGKNLHVEVNTEKEADLIETIDNAVQKTNSSYRELIYLTFHRKKT